MRVTIVTCDNCGAKIEDGSQAKQVMSMEWCPTCVVAGHDLTIVKFADWPRWLRKDDVRHFAEQRDKLTDRLAELVRLKDEEINRLTQQIEGARRLAADGYAGGDLAQALLDIVSDARRAQEIGERAASA